MSQDERREIEAAAEGGRLPLAAQRALEAYREHLADPAQDGSEQRGALVVAWAPGRVNLIGEHTDYNDGFALPVAINRFVALAGRAVDGTTTTCYSAHHQQLATFAADRVALAAEPPAPRLPLWTRYVRGVLVELGEQHASEAETPAFAAAIAGDVPVGGGMSSSAALEVATATFVAALGGPTNEPMTTARLCQRAEQRSTGAQVGVMDQATACLGRAGYAILLDCRSLAYEYVAVNMPGVVLAVYDTHVAHSNASSGYNERRRQCEAATRLFADAIHVDAPERSVHSLRDISAEDITRYGAHLPDVLLQRARHVVSENARTLQAVAALRAGDVETLGALLDASHVSLRDDYEVSCDELNAAVEIARGTPGVFGARMMGGGFGGSALILARSEAQPALAAALAQEYPRRTGRQGALHICEIAGGPGYHEWEPST